MIAVLCSGGIDSLVHLRWAEEKFGRDAVFPIYYDVGQVYAERERRHARKVVEALGYKLKEIRLPTLYEDRETGHVSLRNLFFLLHTAIDPSCQGVVFGMLLAEAPVDKTPWFVSHVQRLIDSQFAATVYRKQPRWFTIYTPFESMSKTKMLEWYLRRYNDDFLYDTVACYTEGEVMCGECISCFNRWLSFATLKLYPEAYLVHPAQGMLNRLTKLRVPENKDIQAIGWHQAWKRRAWVWEAWWAVDAYCREQLHVSLLKWLWHR